MKKKLIKAAIAIGAIVVFPIAAAMLIGLVLNSGFQEMRENPMTGPISAMALGNSTVLAVQPDGELWTWGMVVGRHYSQAANPYTPILPPEIVEIQGVVTSVSTFGTGNMSNAQNHAMAVTADGVLYGWGFNNNGQLGDGTFAMRTTPVRIKEDVIAVATGQRFTVAITSDGTLYGWGDNTFGQLTVCPSELEFSNRPIVLMEGVTAVAAGWGHVLAIMSDGTLYGWGMRTGLGTGALETIETVAEMARPQPTRIKRDVIAIAAGSTHSLAITSDGTLWAWGGSIFGQVGNGTTGFVPYPVRIKQDVVAIATSFMYSAAITADGGLYTWGEHDRPQWAAQLDRILPERVMDDVTQVYVGRFNTMAITADGVLYGWGSNTFGQLQDRTRITRDRPVRIHDFALGENTSDDE